MKIMEPMFSSDFIDEDNGTYVFLSSIDPTKRHQKTNRDIAQGVRKDHFFFVRPFISDPAS